ARRMRHTTSRSGASHTLLVYFFQADDGVRGFHVTGVQTCALPISRPRGPRLKIRARHEFSEKACLARFSQRLRRAARRVMSSMIDRKSVVEGKSEAMGGAGSTRDTTGNTRLSRLAGRRCECATDQR